MWLLLVMLMKETDHRDKEVGKPIYTYIINLKVTLSGCLSVCLSITLSRINRCTDFNEICH